jgi:predicted transcriptional regulator
MAAKMSQSQHEVWESVAAMQSDLSASMAQNLCADASPTSYQLTMEHADLQKQKESFRASLTKIIDDVPDAVGYAFAINGVLNTADVYGSGALFRKLWSKLLDAAVIEAISESSRRSNQKTEPLNEAAIRTWFEEADRGKVSRRQEVPPRVSVATRRSEKSVLFDTHDHGLNDAILHQNLVAN